RYFYTLSRTPIITGDSGFVDVFGSVYLKVEGEIEITIFRYTFVKDGSGRWLFLRRRLLYAA
ncbi:MAG: hypothetical protein ABJE10_12860, partial [bacterium]